MKNHLLVFIMIVFPLSLYSLPDQDPIFHSLDVATLESCIETLNKARVENQMLSEKVTDILDQAEEALDKDDYFKIIDIILQSCLYSLERIKHYAMNTIGIETSKVLEVVKILSDRKESLELVQ